MDLNIKMPTRAEVNLDWCDLSDNPRDNRRLGSSSMASVARPMYEPVSVNDKSDARYWLDNVGKKLRPMWKLVNLVYQEQQRKLSESSQCINHQNPSHTVGAYKYFFLFEINVVCFH